MTVMRSSSPRSDQTQGTCVLHIVAFTCDPILTPDAAFYNAAVAAAFALGVVVLTLSSHPNRPLPSRMFLARKTAYLSANHPFLTITISLLPSVIALIILFSTSSLRIVSPTLSAFLLREASQTRLHHARLAAKQTFPVPNPTTLGLKLHRATFSPRKSLVLLMGPLNITQRTITRVAFLENIIVKGQWNRICRFDSIGPRCRKGDCAQALSVLNSPDLYGIENEAGDFCSRRDHLLPEGLLAFKQSLKEGAFSESPKLVATQGEQVFLRSIFQVGEPFEGFDPSQKDAQTQFYESWVHSVASEVSAASTAEVPSILFGEQLLEQRIREHIWRDLVLAAPAICLIFGIIWLHTGSLFLAFVAMLQIFLSFPIAYMIYTYILRQMYFSALQIFAIFLLLGIGADDVFLFVDAWKQAPADVKDQGLQRHLEWAYERAVKAMFTTTMTTAAAFSITAASSIMPMSTFGVWATILILIQFVMVITVYPSALIIWQRYLLRTKFCCCMHWIGDGIDKLWNTCIPPAWQVKQTDDEQMRLLERFFHGPWVRMLQFLKVPLVLIGVAILAVTIYLASRLKPPVVDPQFLTNGDPLTFAMKVMDDEFRTADSSNLYVVMSWGIRNINRKDTSRFEPGNIGTVVIDDSFDLKLESAQRHILDVCGKLKGGPNASSGGTAGSIRVACWIEDFVSWKTNSNRSQFETYENDVSLVYDVLNFAMFRNAENKQPFLHYLVEQTIMLSTDLRRVISCEIRILTSIQTNISYQEMGKVYDNWQDRLAELNALGPASANKAIVTADKKWASQVTQQTLVKTMARNILIMLFVITLTLSVTTFNLGVSCIATLCLSGIISSLFAIIFLAGWHLGVTESIIITVAMGYSFDGVAHIAMAYTQSDQRDRFSRTQYALATLGISIIFGALSTLGSALMLLPAAILVFSQLAKLVIATVVLTLIWSLALLPACLLLVGPQGNFSSTRPFLRWLNPWKDKIHAMESRSEVLIEEDPGKF